MIYIRTYDAPSADRKEILRYAGAKEGFDGIDTLLSSCLDEIKDRLTFKVCYREFPISVKDDIVDMGFVRTVSRSLAKNLGGCESIVLFAATIGIELDRLIARYSALSPTKALLFQAIGAERIESLCNIFNREISAEKAEEGRATRPRFSAGYGDLSIEVQRDIFAALDCQRKIGLTLNDSLLMSPSKSVTAVIGVENRNEDN